MSSVRKNIIANFAGSAWSSIMGLAFVPLYIKLMGIEAYGLIGFIATIQVAIGSLDLGLSQSLNREMARLSSLQNPEQELVNTARTLEIIYWGMAIAVFFLLTVSAPFIAQHWLVAQNISDKELIDALRLVAVLIAVRWPVSIYSGGLNGLQRQLQLNIIRATFETFQGVGAVLVLMFISPTIDFYLKWLLIVTVFQVVVMRYSFWNCLPDGYRSSFELSILKKLWRFTAGMIGISFTAILLTQADKIILSKLLSLSDFGYYTLASTAAMIIGKITAPVFTAYYPKLASLVAVRDHEALTKTYHKGCQLLAVAVFPVAWSLIFFSNEILFIWTQDLNVASKTATLLVLLVIGNTLNGLMTLPYLLQLAHGWTSLTFYTNLILVAFTIPGVYLAALFFGGVGAATIWIVVNASYVLVSLHLIHRRLLVTEKWHWYINDVGRILLTTLAVILLGKFFVALIGSAVLRVVLIAVTGLIAIMAAYFSAESLVKNRG